MSRSVTIEVEMPGGLPCFELPAGVENRLRLLLDRHERRELLNQAEEDELIGLKELAKTVAIFRTRRDRRLQT